MDRAGLNKIAELKAALTPLPSSAPRGAPIPTGWPAVDALLGGGLPAGRLAELVGGRSSGKASLALRAAAAVTTAPGPRLAAWVDARRELYPPSAAALGVALERLLIVTPAATAPAATVDALAVARAGEILAKSRAFALIVLDLPDHVRLGEALATRLRQAAHESGAAIVALAGAPNAVPHAALRLHAAASHEGPAALRRVAFTLAKGGAAPPGGRAEVSLGHAGADAFRPAAHREALEAAAAAIVPVAVGAARSRRAPRRRT